MIGKGLGSDRRGTGERLGSNMRTQKFKNTESYST